MSFGIWLHYSNPTIVILTTSYLTTNLGMFVIPLLPFSNNLTNNSIINYPLQKSTSMLNLERPTFLCIFSKHNKSNHNCGLWHKTIKYKILNAQYICNATRGREKEENVFIHLYSHSITYQNKWRQRWKIV